MQDGGQLASAHRHTHQRGARGRLGPSRSNQRQQSGDRDRHDPRTSQPEPTQTVHGLPQSAAQPQHPFIPQRMVVLMGLPGSGTVLELRLAT